MYRIVPDPEVLEQVAALSDETLAAYAELLDVLQLMPWNGLPQHEANPDDAGRSAPAKSDN